MPGPKHNIGQDPSRTTTQTTPTATTKDLCPSLHLGPSSQLVDEGGKLSPSLHLGLVDETRGCARTQAQYRPGPKPNDDADDTDRDDY